MVVLKFPIRARQGGTTVQMPAGAVVLSVEPARDHVWLFAECDPGAGRQTRRFLLAATGGDCLDKHPIREFVGTAVCGANTWHVYEVPASSR